MKKICLQKITEDYIKKIGFKNIEELATSLADGKIALSKLKPLKPWFALAPPRHGFKKSTKRLSSQKGVLGQNKDLVNLVRNMM